MDDTRCREYVREYCQDNSNLRECVTRSVTVAKTYCQKNPDSNLCSQIDDRLVNFCRDNPDNEGCVRATEILQNRTQVLNRIRQYVTKRISELRESNEIPSLGNVDVVSGEG
jgi:hypothetical protein